MTILEKIGAAAIIVPLFTILYVALLIVPTWWAWNTFMPAVFGLPEINFLQAFAFILLTGALRTLFAETANAIKK